MKKIVAASFALLLGTILSGVAQVSVELVMEQEHFLVGETIPAAVRITNRSGQTLRLGADADWLSFGIESRDGAIVAKNGEVPVQGEFVLESGKVATRRVELLPYFGLNRVGRYHVTARVRIKDWDKTLSTQPKAFELIKGAKLWSQEFGLPMPPGVTNRAPEVRSYHLEQANYLRTQLRLYLRITAAGGEVIKVLPIGTMVSISNPEHQIDHANNLHVLYQHGARSYLYTVITPDGEVSRRQTYEIATSRPKLQVDGQGRLAVVGGQRRSSDSDFPPPTEIETNAPPQNQ